jgi:hypothetical protein
MSALDVEQEAGFGLRSEQGVAPVAQQAPTDGGEAVFGAAFRQSNSVVSAIQYMRNSGSFAPVPDYNPLTDIKKWDKPSYFLEHGDKFVGSQSPAETQSIKGQIDSEEADKKTLATNGKLGFIAQTMAGSLDPTMLLPGGVAIDAAKGGLTFAKAAVQVGKAGFMQSVAQEALLHGSQDTRTFTESALNVASGTLLTALIGGGAASLLAPAERAALETRLHADRAEMNEHAGNPGTGETAPPSPSGTQGEAIQPVAANVNEPVGNALAASVGAAASDTRKIELVPFGLDQIPGVRTLVEKTSPMQRLFGAEAVTVRRAAADLAETSLLTKENLEGKVTTAGPALDREARLNIHQGQVAVGDELSRLFSEYRFGEQKTAPRTRALFEDATGRATEGKMSFDQFKESVTDALRNGDTHENPQVQMAAQTIRSKVFDPWKKRAIDAGLLPEDVGVKTADSYVSRLYNKQAIAAKRPDFVNRVTDWLAGDQTQKAQTKQNLDLFNGQLRSWSGEVDKFDRHLEALSAKTDQLSARLDEKAKDARTAEKRTDVLTDRASSIAEEIREVKAFVAEARAGLRDPALIDRLNQLEKDANDLRRAESPVTEEDLKKLEEEELKGVLTGTARKAAEMLTGRRKTPETPSFLSWIIKQGGIKAHSENIGDVLASIDPKSWHGQRIIKKEGHTLESLADKIGEDFPDSVGFGEMDANRGRPTAAQVLQYINDAAHGREPDFFLNSHPNRENLEAARMSAMLDEVFTRAGVDVKTPKDVAAVLAGDRRYGVTLQDLDKIAADMQASGESIPLSMWAAHTGEQLSATKAQVQELRNVIANGLAARDAKEQRILLAEARGSEVATFERQARGRLGVLQERLSLADRRRELLLDAKAIAERNRDEVRAKIEEQIAGWEGKSVSEAKSALKAREKDEQGRAPDADRLASADKAVDRAVRKILGSDRDLSRQEMESRANEITDRIIGSPDGRLPYDLGMEHGTAHGGSGEAPRGALAAREFNIPDKTITDFLENDAEHIVAAHLRTMVPDVLLTEKFGDTRMSEAFRKINDEYAELSKAAKSEGARTALEKERQRAIDDLSAVRDRIRGIYGISPDMPLRNAARVMNVIKNYNVLTSMGSAALSSLPDMAGSVMRHGLTATFNDAWSPFFSMLTRQSDVWQEAGRQYRAMGIAVESVLASRHHALADTLDTYHPQSRVERTMQWATGKFQFINMLAPWTDFAKINASMVSGSEILRATKAAAEGKASARMLRTLGESGIEPHMAERIAKAFEDGGEVRDGVHLPNTADWTDKEARRVFEGAVARDADIAVVTPGQEKPLWMSQPLLSVLGQFKSFTAAATERILISNLQRRDAQVLQGMIFSMGLGMLSYKINSLTGGQPASDKPQDWIKESISRGNLLGWFEEGNALVSKATGAGWTSTA